jgi:WS/DGAT/MGAT family acyltransferase
VTVSPRLSPIDASFLSLESSRAHMNVGWSGLGPLTEGAERPTIDALRERVESRMRDLPRCRQRLQFHPLGLGEPHWVDDPAFEIDAHVIPLSGPDEPLSLQRFEELRDELLSAPLDRSRPLWQIALAPLLEDGRVAIVGRVHHAMADGTAAIQVASLALDLGGEELPTPKQPSQAEPPSRTALRAVDPLLHGAEVAAQAVGDAARAALRPRESARGVLRDAQRVVDALTEDLLPRAPESQLNNDLGPRRTLVSHRESLEDLHGVPSGTLNDVGLAIVAGALRALALERGQPAHPLKALVPVDTRGRRERGTLGNHVSLAAVWLPLHLATADARLAHVGAATDRFKRAGRPAGARSVFAGISLVPSGLRGVVLRAASAGSFNLTVSSIPGPRKPLHLLGARLDEIYPVVPVAPDGALSVGMFRYNRHLCFGIHADPDAFPEVTWLPDLIGDEVRALRDSLDEKPARRPAVAVAAGRTPVTS